jgi:glutathione peroxidase
MPPSAHDHAFTSIDGAPLPLTEFRDKVVLVVNTASKCGLTPQYAGLEQLYSDYKDRGLVVLGVPCNQFLFQEPGTEAQIKDFCETRFHIDFPMTSKVDVKGKKAHAFYKWAEAQLGKDAVPSWNFHKILIGKGGEAIGAFGPRTEPGDPGLVAEIEKAL